MLSEAKVEVISQKGQKIYSKIMTLSEWKKLKRNPEYKYKAYQIGFAQYKNKIKL